MNFVIFEIQVILSKWIKYFQMGPVERLWCPLTYGEKPPFNKSPSH
ncbi:DUF418 domain-containing protein [Brevibacillus laterosporus]